MIEILMDWKIWKNVSTFTQNILRNSEKKKKICIFYAIQFDQDGLTS